MHLGALGVDADALHAPAGAGQADRGLERARVADGVDARRRRRGLRSPRAIAARGRPARSGGRGSAPKDSAIAQPLGHRVDREHAAPRRPRARPATAHSPTGPSPSTAATSPGRMPLASTAWKPVPITSPANSATSLLIPSGTLPQHEVGVGDERHLGLRALQRAERRAVPEGARAARSGGTGRAGRRSSSPQAVWKQPSTRSPTATRVTASPAATHRADVLVPDREAGLDLDAAVVDVQVRAAHAGRLDAHDRVAGVEQLGLGTVLDADDAGGLEGDGAHRAQPIRPPFARCLRIDLGHDHPSPIWPTSACPICSPWARSTIGRRGLHAFAATRQNKLHGRRRKADRPQPASLEAHP